MFYNFTKRSVASLLIVASLLVANIYLYRVVTTRADGLTHIYILDVGQGDSILIRTADQQTILIDGGPSGKVLDRLATILPPWDNEINLLVATHPDSDHIGGLVPLLENYQVDHLWYNGASHDTQTYASFLDLLEEHQIPTTKVEHGTQAAWQGSQLTVAYPLAGTAINSLSTNEAGIVSKFTAGSFDLMLTADIGAVTEKQLATSNLLAPVEVIKVPHHGSRFSSSLEFIRELDPEIAIVSVGANNTYNHPHPEVVTRYNELAIPLYRTDTQGTIEIITDGTYYKVRTAR